MLQSSAAPISWCFSREVFIDGPGKEVRAISCVSNAHSVIILSSQRGLYRYSLYLECITWTKSPCQRASLGTTTIGLFKWKDGKNPGFICGFLRLLSPDREMNLGPSEESRDTTSNYSHEKANQERSHAYAKLPYLTFCFPCKSIHQVGKEIWSCHVILIPFFILCLCLTQWSPDHASLQVSPGELWDRSMEQEGSDSPKSVGTMAWLWMVPAEYIVLW